MSLRASLLAFFAQIYYRGAKVLQNSEMTKCLSFKGFGVMITIVKKDFYYKALWNEVNTITLHR